MDIVKEIVIGLTYNSSIPACMGYDMVNKMLYLKPVILLPVIIIVFTIMYGCAGTKTYAPTMAFVEGISGHLRMGQILDLRAGKVLSFEKFIDQIMLNDLIFIGEVHDNPEHHLIHVQILQALVDRCGPVNIAMEFFPRTRQRSIDRYLQGELTEAEFLKETEWKNAWGFDYSFYRSIMLLAKHNGSRVLAINIPRDIVKKVARHGLKSLDKTERDRLPKVIDLNNEAHRAHVRDAYEKHNHRVLKKFDYFYEAQCMWEDGMAHNLAEYLRGDKRKAIVFTGNGHIINKFGIPTRTIKRLPISMVTIMPFPLSENVVIKKETADYIWLTANYPHRYRMFRN